MMVLAKVGNRAGSMPVRFFFIAAVAVVLFSTTSYAAQMTSMFRGVRPAGMGGAFTSIADDENAVFYNPAGLAEVHKHTLELINPLVDVSNNVINLANDAKNLQTGDTVGAVNLLKQYVGKPEYARVDVFPNFTMHDFELGVYGQGEVNAGVHTPSYPVFTADIKADAGAVLGLAHSFMDDRLDLGISAKFIQRRMFHKELTALDLANSSNNLGDQFNFNNNLKTSNALGFDIGMIYKFSNQVWNPKLGISVLNIGDINFGDYVPAAGSSVTTPIANKIPQTVNLGGSINHTFWILNTTLAADYLDLLNNASKDPVTGLSDSDYGKRLHAGLEIKLPYVLSLRAGINQGYYTYGAGLNFWLIEVRYAYYKEEVGAYAGQLADERQMLQAIIGF